VRGALLGFALIAGCGFRSGEQGFQPQSDAAAGSAQGDAGAFHDGPLDAAFSVADCPASYTVTIAHSSSRYRLIGTLEVFSDSNDACNADLPGATHLAALDTVGEEEDLQALILDSIARYYVGAIQAPGETAFDVGWSLVTGASLPPGLWDAGEPNDGGLVTTDQGYQQFGELAPENGTPGLHDDDPDQYDGAICECDGLPVPSAITSEIAAQIPTN